MSIIIFPLCVLYSSFNYPISSLTQKHCLTASPPSLAQHPTSWLLPCPQFPLPSSLPTSRQPFLNNFPLSSLYSLRCILHGTVMCFWEKKRLCSRQTLLQLFSQQLCSVPDTSSQLLGITGPSVSDHWSEYCSVFSTFDATLPTSLLNWACWISRHSAFVWLLLIFSDILFWLRKKEMEEGVGLLSTELLISCCMPQGGHINS